MGNNDNIPLTKQQATASGGSSIVQVDGNRNNTTVIQQRSDGGMVVGLYMPSTAGLGEARWVDCIHLKVGETIQPDAPLITFLCAESHYDDDYGPSSSCSNFTLPSPVAGVIESIRVVKGEEVDEGHLLATVRVWKPAEWKPYVPET